jgi:hypothetical protein
MKLFAAVIGWDCEGYDKPDGIFSTPEQAWEVFKAGNCGDIQLVVEYELDNPEIKIIHDKP